MAKKVSDKEFIKKEKSYLQKLSQKSIKESLCKKCCGVIVRSYITSLMAVSYGKRCECWKMNKTKNTKIERELEKSLDMMDKIDEGKATKEEIREFEREGRRLDKEQGWKNGKEIKKKKKH